jgi:hypothetical protein
MRARDQLPWAWMMAKDRYILDDDQQYQERREALRHIHNAVHEDRECHVHAQEEAEDHDPENCEAERGGRLEHLPLRDSMTSGLES